MTTILTMDQRVTLHSAEFMKAANQQGKPGNYLHDSGSVIIMPLHDLVFTADIYSAYFNGGRRKGYSAHVNGKPFAAVLPFREAAHDQYVFNLKPNIAGKSARDLLEQASRRSSVVLAHKEEVFALMLPYAALKKELAIAP